MREDDREDDRGQGNEVVVENIQAIRQVVLHGIGRIKRWLGFDVGDGARAAITVDASGAPCMPCETFCGGEGVR